MVEASAKPSWLPLGRPKPILASGTPLGSAIFFEM